MGADRSEAMRLENDRVKRETEQRIVRKRQARPGRWELRSIDPERCPSRAVHKLTRHRYIFVFLLSQQHREDEHRLDHDVRDEDAERDRASETKKNSGQTTKKW